MGIATSTAPFSLTDGSITIAKFASGVANIKVLGSGSYTSTTNGAYEDVGNFTIPGDIGSGKVICKIWAYRSSGVAANNKVGFDNAAGNSIDIESTGTTHPDIQVEWVKNPVTATKTDYVALNAAAWTSAKNSDYFVMNASEVVYLKLWCDAAASVIKCNWIAYQIGGLT